jgi:hypothetical protein
MAAGLVSYLRRHHIGLVALCIALTGTAYAAQLPRNSVGGAQLARTNHVGPLAAAAGALAAVALLVLIGVPPVSRTLERCVRRRHRENAVHLADYHRRWQQANRDKVRAQGRRYRERNAQDPRYLERKRARDRRYRERKRDDPQYRERKRARDRRYRERKRARLSDANGD